MLFELAVAMAEQMLAEKPSQDWGIALSVALERQRRHFDAREPVIIQAVDKRIALQVADNLTSMLRAEQLGAEAAPIVHAPAIPGYQWIASGVGDFAIGRRLIEVKCTNRNFSSADYRQVLMYWLLSYVQAVEHNEVEWSHVTLLNPRRCSSLTLAVDELLMLLSGGKSKIELLQLFATIVHERGVHKPR